VVGGYEGDGGKVVGGASGVGGWEYRWEVAGIGGVCWSLGIE
jgi:hypothetical protein